MISIKRAGVKKNLILRGFRRGGENVRIAKVSVLTPGGDKVIWDSSTAPGGMAVGIMPPFVTGGAASGASVTVAVASAIAAASGGVPPYTYLWTIETTDGSGFWNIVSITSPNTYFRCTSMPPFSVGYATMRCTATDSLGNTASATLAAEANNYGPL